MTYIRTSLERHQPRTPINADELQRYRVRAWHEQGIAILPVDD